MVNSEFLGKIKEFNEMYGLPVNGKPELQGVERLKNFKSILSEEVDEVDDIIKKYEELSFEGLDSEKRAELLTEISDWLGDMIVYISSEAAKHGLDLDKTLGIIMESNFSKLGEDGKPIYDDRGKVMKGPGYWRPEEKIKEHLLESMEE